jgi:hypothetical protein
MFGRSIDSVHLERGKLFQAQIGQFLSGFGGASYRVRSGRRSIRYILSANMIAGA